MHWHTKSTLISSFGNYIAKEKHQLHWKMGALTNLRNLIFIMALSILCSCFQTTHAREIKSWWTQSEAATGQDSSSNHIWADKAKPGAAPPQPATSGTFNVLDYGAKGNGGTDDTKAFQAAWAAACKVQASTLLVPSGSAFVVHPISFAGPCATDIVFQLDGTILAPSSKSWSTGLQWIEFRILKGFTIKGSGTIDGQGSFWWNDTPSYDPDSEQETAKLSATESQSRPTAVRFYGSTDVTVTSITIRNSPQTHLKFDSCTVVRVFNFTVSSPGNSPNTDGIHLQNSQDVLVYNSNLACGDDCVSIQTGCSNVYIHDVNCGPGHGISIGALGKDNTKACASNITVKDVSLQNTLTGVRIKTWQGGSGSVQGIMFSNIQVSGVETPIMIDQFYCDKSKCQNNTSAVAVSGINYVNVKGTYTVKPVHFACSNMVPCTGVSLATIELRPAKEDVQPYCLNTYGEIKTSTVPPIDCLQTGKSPKPVDSCST